jgi:inosose dehydratase
MGKRQRFELGYALISWDFVGEPLDEALAFLGRTGFRWFETVVGDSLMMDVARRYMRPGTRGLPPFRRDYEMLQRLGLFARAERDYGLRPASLYTNGEFVNPQTWPVERDVMLAVARFLHGCGSTMLVTGGGPPEAVAPHTADDYRLFASRLEELGRLTAEFGVRTLHHPHLDCFVESGEQLDRLLDVLDTELVGLCLDPAHLQATGTDPVQVLRTHRDRVDYVHVKDVRVGDPPPAGPARYQAFCELGAGSVDLRSFVDVLLESEYDGIAMIELDRSQKGGETSCLESVAYVTDVLGLALVPESEPEPEPAR